MSPPGVLFLKSHREHKDLSMKRLIQSLWKDQSGFVVSTELMIVATILVVGLIAGVAHVRTQLVQELSDLGTAVSNFDQSYSYTAVAHASSADSTAGGLFADVQDTYDGTSGAASTSGVTVTTAGAAEAAAVP
jgi:Flp pilus assembly pilin Flp